MQKVHQITPFLHVPNLDSAIAFFCDLTFSLRARHSNYAYVELAGCGLRLLEEPTRKLQADGKPRVTVYVDVEDIDAFHSQLIPALANLSPDRVEPLKNMPYGQREFQVRMPDGDWLNFGGPAKVDGPSGS